MSRVAASFLVVGLVFGAAVWSLAQQGPGPRGFTGPHAGYQMGGGPMAGPGRMGTRQLTDQQIEWMAKPHGLTPEQVRQRLESCRALTSGITPGTETTEGESSKTEQ